MQSIRLTIVIAVYNRKAITLNCLRQLKEQTCQDFTVIVVDDGSTDGTAEAIIEGYPSTIVSRGAGNWWWTKSVNEGIRSALVAVPTHILLLNDDTFFEKDYIASMIAEIRENPASLIGSLNLTREKPHRVYFSGASRLNPVLFKYTRYHKTFSIYREDPSVQSYPSVYLPARGALVPAAVFNKIGLLNEKSFPQYASDVDFTLRAAKAGFSIYVSSKVKLYTPVDSTGTGDIYKRESFFRFLSSFNNKYSKRDLRTHIRLIRDHVPVGMVPFAFLSYTGTILAKYLIHNIRN